MLFADGSDSGFGAGLGLAGVMLSVANGFFLWLNQREKRLSDISTIELKGKVEQLTAKANDNGVRADALELETSKCHEARENDRQRHDDQIRELWKMIGERRHDDSGPPDGQEERRAGN